MRRFAGIALVFGLLFVACNVDATPKTSSPGATADIRRSKIDITYSDLMENDVHNVSSKAALQGAINALKAEAKKTGGTDDFPALDFQDTTEAVLPDFAKFADAAAAFAARNRQISRDRFADVAIAGMIGATPDCHTYYVNADGAGFLSRPVRPTGTNAQIPAEGASLGAPDRAGLTGKMLPGGIAYITWHEFITDGTYKIGDTLRAMLDKAVAMGAKAWLFDLRGNNGGVGPTDAMSSWFLNGQPTLTTIVKSGNGGTANAIKELRLPDEYQLPMAILLNDRGGSGPEVLTAALKENKRATIIGQRSVGCVGGFFYAQFPDGGQIAVAAFEFVGAVTGTKYNNVGISPDISADDTSAVSKAVDLLKQKIAGG